jgi:hypothetical protein
VGSLGWDGRLGRPRFPMGQMPDACLVPLGSMPRASGERWELSVALRCSHCFLAPWGPRCHPSHHSARTACYLTARSPNGPIHPSLDPSDTSSTPSSPAAVPQPPHVRFKQPTLRKSSSTPVIRLFLIFLCVLESTRDENPQPPRTTSLPPPFSEKLINTPSAPSTLSGRRCQAARPSTLATNYRSSFLYLSRNARSIPRSLLSGKGKEKSRGPRRKAAETRT